MAFNNGFPMGYGYQMPQIQTPQMPQAAQNSSLIWVQGEAGAKSYLVAPNSAVTLWDSEQNTIYVKSADSSGMPTLKILDYTIRNSSEPKIDITQQKDYATKEDVSKEIKRLEEIIENIKDSLSA